MALMSSACLHERNRTASILNHAAKHGYAVGAFNCYNDDGVMAVIQAAERMRSPAIIQVFPWTLHFQGIHFIRWIVDYAHNASVPVAVHLDHCIENQDVQVALELPFDSIMVDASTQEGEENLEYCKVIVGQARERGITIEAEMGRIQGGEDGLANVDMEAIMTTPEDAARFVKETGVRFLAPSFGNVHGLYPPGGAETCWELDRLESIAKSVGPSIPLVLHGTHPVSDQLFQKAIKLGMRKINLNRSVRESYTKFVAEKAGSLELTELKEQAVEIYSRDIERMMCVLGSVHQA